MKSEINIGPMPEKKELAAEARPEPRPELCRATRSRRLELDVVLEALVKSLNAS